MPSGVYIRNKKQHAGMFGKKHSEATIKKMKASHLGHKGYVRTDEIREKNRQGQLGKKHSNETLEKMRIFKLKNPIRYWLGKKRPYPSMETRRKLSEANKRLVVEGRHNFWRGGMSLKNKTLRQNIMNTFEYAEWRRLVFERDNFTCQTCNQRGKIINADHIKLFSIILFENKIKTIENAIKCNELWDINNGQTLCEACHEEKTIQDMMLIRKEKLWTC